VAATLARTTGLTVEVDTPTPHDTDWTDEPDVQASDEHRQIRTARTVMNAFQGPDVRAVQKTARERHMADRLATLREEGAVVAVVGIGHLDALAERLGP
jgi:pheromone shutdown protein TraB